MGGVGAGRGRGVAQRRGEGAPRACLDPQDHQARIHPSSGGSLDDALNKDV